MLVPFSAGIVLALCSLRCEAQTPEITSFSAISTQQTQTIAITGSGFGTQGPYAGNSLYIEFFDFTAGWAAGYSGPCYNGHVYYGGTCSDAVNLVVQSWTDSKIVLGGAPTVGRSQMAIRHRLAYGMRSREAGLHP
jgi:hypothetical protein